MTDFFTAEYEARMQAEYDRIRNRHPALITKPFECLTGWFGIIEAYFDEVAGLLSEHSGSSYELRQVKEKLGGLRLYSRASEDIRPQVQAVYDRAARHAERTCDVCGAVGQMRRIPPGFYATRCDEHADGGETMPPQTWKAAAAET